MGYDFSKIDGDEVLQAVEDAQVNLENPGFCLGCGERVEGVEPDADGYECECCGQYAVYGAEQLLLMGAVN